MLQIKGLFGERNVAAAPVRHAQPRDLSAAAFV
jgi:hypothetical protein